MNFNSFIVKLLILLITGLMIIAPSATDKEPAPQIRAEQLIGTFLSGKGSYMALYFNDIDTAFTTLEEDSVYKDLSKRVLAYQDSTIMFSRMDVDRAVTYFNTYKKLNLEKDSL